MAGVLGALLLVQFAMPLDLKLPQAALAPVRHPRSIASAPPLPPYPGIESGALFAPDRRGGGESGAGVAVGGLDDYAALGVALSPQGAAVTMKGPGGYMTLHPGQSLAGWRLSAVGRDRVFFAKPGASRTLFIGAPTTTRGAPPEITP